MLGLLCVTLQTADCRHLDNLEDEIEGLVINYDNPVQLKIPFFMEEAFKDKILKGQHTPTPEEFLSKMQTKGNLVQA